MLCGLIQGQLTDFSASSKHNKYVLFGSSPPAVCQPWYISLKVCVLVVQIRPWHVLWLSPLVQHVFWGACEFYLPLVCCHSDWTRCRLRRWCVGQLCDTSLIFSFDPLIDWLQEQRINRAHKSRFHSPFWSGLDKASRPEVPVSSSPSSIWTYEHWRWLCAMVA